ncbi:hypothetical protein VTN00DRAFT_9908 [Thermoascus crustaceus]|uniref:uncharacterized protein n=1 Tax=Thermoascus crustaceus TaxID=5088 RepID=UPI003743646F
MDEQGGLQESGFQDSVKSVAQEWLEMVQSTVQSPDTHQSPLVKLPQKYRKLNNLLMQTRKCCVRPYLLETPGPEAHDNENHVIEASGKFIVLLTLVQDLVVGQGKKVLIFSGFDYALNCCEDLLDIASEDGSTFRYVQIDGTTPSARRNLNIYLFSTNSAYKRHAGTIAQEPGPARRYINEEVEKAWLQRLERVETSVFNGTKVDTSPRKGASSNKDDDILNRASRRIGKSRTVIIDGFHVAKETLDCKMGEAVRMMAGKDPRLAAWKREQKPQIIHQAACFFCKKRCNLEKCKSCPRAFHMHCLDRALVPPS